MSYFHAVVYNLLQVVHMNDSVRVTPAVLGTFFVRAFENGPSTL